MPFDGTTLPQTALNLMRAKARIEKGWCKNTFEDSRGRVCALGPFFGDSWLSKYAKELELLKEAIPKDCNIRPESWNGDIFDIAVFNNARSTTKEDVLALYDKAIELAIAEATVTV
jgi:hypothetical protein